MVFKNLFIFVLWAKIASALEGLKTLEKGYSAHCGYLKTWISLKPTTPWGLIVWEAGLINSSTYLVVLT